MHPELLLLKFLRPTYHHSNSWNYLCPEFFCYWNFWYHYSHSWLPRWKFFYTVYFEYMTFRPFECKSYKAQVYHSTPTSYPFVTLSHAIIKPIRFLLPLVETLWIATSACKLLKIVKCSISGVHFIPSSWMVACFICQCDLKLNLSETVF